MKKPIIVGIIGCGVIAPEHIRGYQRIPDVTVKWACDLVLPKAEKCSQEFGIARITQDYSDIINDPEVDCISICTDHASHAQIFSDALRHDKHVLCEKALAASPQQLEIISNAIHLHPTPVAAGVFQHRFDSIYQKIKEVIDRGDLGVLLTASLRHNCLRTDDYYKADAWRGTWDKEGGSALINQAIHYIDSLSWIAGGVYEVCGTWSNRTHPDSIQTEDTASASLRCINGALGTILVTASSHLEWEPTFSFCGSNGIIDIVNGRIARIDMIDKAREKQLYAEFEACGTPAVLKSEKGYYGPNHSSQIADFVAAIQTARKPFVSALAARHAVDIVHAVYQSHREKRWIEISPPLP